MLKHILLLWVLYIHTLSFSQSIATEYDGIVLKSKKCNIPSPGYMKRDSTGLIRGWRYPSHLSHDSLVQIEVNEGIPLRPIEVHKPLEISISEEGMEGLLEVLQFKRKFGKYKWILAWCSYPEAGIDPAQTVRAKEIMSVWFEVNALNEIEVTHLTQYARQKKMFFLSHQPKRADKEAFTSLFIQSVKAKSAVWMNKNVLAKDVLWIYCPSNYWKKMQKKK